jgi:RNA polymerase sigma factor (sigma-70 family)
MSNDTELLRQFAEEHSESAFAELVRDHLNVVYSAALRETGGERQTAEDVCQAVFTELARKASSLVKHPCLAGWLYTTVRHKAANWRRAERQRKVREEEAQSMKELQDSPDEAWQQIRPVLDDALHELKEADRAVVVLRFLEGRTLREVGARLGLNENAARMRADRALEKLRGLLARRGITSTAAGLAAALAIGIVTPAPESLAASIAGAALAGGVAAGSTTLTLVKLMSIPAVKASLVGALVVAGIAIPAWQQTRLQRVEAQNAQFEAQQTQLQANQTELASLRAEVARLHKANPGAAELEGLRQWKAKAQPELLRLRGMAGVARRAISDEQRLQTQLAQQSSETAPNSVSSAMGEAMKNAMEQQYEGRLSRMTADLRLTPDQVAAARKILMRQADAMAKNMQQTMSGHFNKEEMLKTAKEGGNPDEEIQALLTPEQKADYQTYKNDEASHTASMGANSELVQMQSSLDLTQKQLDPVYGALYQLSYDQITGHSTPPPGTQLANITQWQIDQKLKALEPILTPAQMETYRQQLAEQAKLAKIINDKIYGGGSSN